MLQVNEFVYVPAETGFMYTPPPSPEMLARMLTAAPTYGVVFA